MSLSEIVIQKIKDEGPISFRDFMDTALYHPVFGYYTSDENKIGIQGDYYTSPVLSSLFGQLLARQIEEMWLCLGKGPFTLVEYGAGTGDLCVEIMDYFKNNSSLYAQVNYCLIEKGNIQMRQKEGLAEKISCHRSIDEIGGAIRGCILSNELVDNFPVHKVVMKDELMEVFVDYKNGFIEVLMPADESLKNYLSEQHIFLPENYSTEINLDAIEWIKDIACRLNEGYVLTIDYGFPSEDLYDSKRNSGTLCCYRNHEVNFTPYANIGHQDITAHVNFSALSYWGKKNALDCLGFTTQAHFLRSLGLINCLRKLEMDNRDTASLYEINQLLMDMGNKFKVLIQQKGIGRRYLTGLQFSEPLF